MGLVYQLAPHTLVNWVEVRIGLVYQLAPHTLVNWVEVRIGLVYQLAPPPSYVLDKAKLV